MIIEGGVPIVHEGKVIGAIGVSGVKSEEDAEVARRVLKSWRRRSPEPLWIVWWSVMKTQKPTSRED